MSSVTTAGRRTAYASDRRGIGLVALVCWVTVALEGFDLVAFAAVIPTLLKTGHLGMTPGDATLVATLSLVGVGIGAAAGGPFIDRFGRRIGLIVSVVVFSIFTLLVPLAPSVGLLAAARLVAGLGLGACMPTAITITTEAASAARRATATTVTMTGYHVGAVVMALLAILVGRSWEWLFYVGGAVGLVLLPLIWRSLAPGRIAAGATPLAHRNAEVAPRTPLRETLRSPFAVATIASWVTSFMGLLLVYGLNTWLPKIMNDAGYSLSSSLTLLLIMNAGAVVGLLLGGVVADRTGIKRSAVLWFGASAVFLALLSIRMDDVLLLDAVVFVTGLFVFSAQGLVYALIAHLYPDAIRGTAMGMASGVGRLGAVTGPYITGTLVMYGLGHPWGFYVFALVALLAVAALAVMPTRPFGDRH